MNRRGGETQSSLPRRSCKNTVVFKTKVFCCRLRVINPTNIIFALIFGFPFPQERGWDEIISWSYQRYIIFYLWFGQFYYVWSRGKIYKLKPATRWAPFQYSFLRIAYDGLV